MEPELERSWLVRHPIKSLIVTSIVSGIAAILLIFTVVGSIIGLPLLAFSAITGLVALYKFRRRWHGSASRH